MKPNWISVLLAVAAFLLATTRINHGLIDSPLPPGAGLTLDESFYIGQGVFLFESLLDWGPALFTPSGAEAVFGHPDYFPDHPPLGKLVLGAAHQSLSGVITGAEESVLNVAAARLGSCFAFGLTVLVLAEFTRRQFGLTTAVLAVVALIIMPRVVGHSRIASLETVTTLAWLAAFIPLWTWWTKPAAPTTRQSIISGILWGLLLLTKVQGILMPPLVIGWALWRYKEKAIRPLAVWGIVGAVVFFVGWPWLWLDPVANTMSYFVKTAQRPTLYVWYFGQRFADKSVPWHFPFVMTLATLPAVVTVLFGTRLVQRKFTATEALMLLSVVWPLIVFAMPGTPVYDGARLFLVIMPAVAVLSARGFASAIKPGEGTGETDKSPRPRWVRLAGLVGVIALSLFSFNKALQPFCLNSYSALVGGERGAQRLGLEAGYWADGLNGDFWAQVPEDSTIYVAPVSHQFQLGDIQHLVPIVAQRNIKLLPFEYDPQAQRGLTLLIHRLADLRPALRDVPEGATVVAAVKYGDVVLARLIDTSAATWPSIPDWPKR